jgi:hypothetical protein
MGNRAIITLENQHGKKHPIGLYVHWHGGLESVLAFMMYTWDTYDRGRDDVFTFHARLCQVLGNFFPDGLSLYGYPLREVRSVAAGCDNGHFHFRVTPGGVFLQERADEVEAAKTNDYWTRPHTIFDSIKAAMPTKAVDRTALAAGKTQGEAVL